MVAPALMGQWDEALVLVDELHEASENLDANLVVALSAAREPREWEYVAGLLERAERLPRGALPAQMRGYVLRFRGLLSAARGNAADAGAAG